MTSKGPNVARSVTASSGSLSRCHFWVLMRDWGV
jgi:hypothetical protein